MIKFERFTNKARESLEKAQEALRQLHQSQLDAEHLLYGIAADTSFGTLFANCLKFSLKLFANFSARS